MIPRYFHPREEKPLAELPLVAIMDAFVLRGRVEQVVAVDMAGQLRLCSPPELPPELRGEYVRLELRRRPRVLRAESLWLMEIEALEQPGKVSGLNDPVHLVGRLFGPWPPPPGGPSVWEGELSLTRGDLLGGFVEERPDALEATNASGERGLVLHAWLPGDREEEVLAGKGGILAWPMVPAELEPMERCNEGLTLELLCAVLAAMQQDVRAEGPKGHPLHSLLLPVADRSALIRAWKADGFVQEGEKMLRRPRGKGILGELASAFTNPEVRRIPPQAELEGTLKLCAELLPLLPGWPEGRYRALQAQRLTNRGVPGPAPMENAKIPVNSFSVEPARNPGSAAADPSPAPTFRREPEPEWQEDFGTQKPPRRTSLRASSRSPEYKATPPPPSGRPAWMDDFE